MNNKSILITGGSGFIGSHIVEYFINKNIKFIRILDNLSTGKMDNIKSFLENPNVEFMYGDISNLDVCRKAMKNIDMICHQAAIGSVPRSVEDPLTSHISNVNGFLNILISAKENNIKRIVYASSSSVYGDDDNLPKEEKLVGNVLSPYAATKKIDEIYANVFTKCYNMEIIGLRYFNIFGPRQDPNGMYAAVIPKFIDMMKKNKSPIINGDGSYSRDFTYVDNAVYANYLALTTNNINAFGNVFNIGTGGNISILELFNIIKNELNLDIKPIFGNKRNGDIEHSHANISLAKNILNYEPIISFNDGIKKTLGINTEYNLSTFAKQCYVSNTLTHFKNRFINKFQLKDYYDINQDSLFFGVYKKEDIQLIVNHKAHKYIIWGGTDANYKLAIDTFKNIENITHIAISSNISYRLNKQNINNIYINFSLLDTNLFKPISKEELGNSIFIYNGYHKNLENNYGKEYYEKVIKILPNYKYIFSNTLNESYENMPNIYKQCFIILRLTHNDGNANTIQEAEALGIPAIHNQSDYGLKWKTVDDIINYIKIYTK